jgi:hypothetical protein
MKQSVTKLGYLNRRVLYRFNNQNPGKNKSPLSPGVELDLLQTRCGRFVEHSKGSLPQNLQPVAFDAVRQPVLLRHLFECIDLRPLQDSSNSGQNV